LYLTRHTSLLREPASVLHFAPERELARRLQAVHGAGYVSGDLDPSLAMQRIDITAIDRPDETFDAVLVSHVLEHVPDDLAAMREIRRVLKHTGIALLQHPVDSAFGETYEDATITDPVERLRAFRQHDHVRIYGRDFDERLTKSGLAFEVITFGDYASDEERHRFALKPRSKTGRGSDIYRCTRAPAGLTAGHGAGAEHR
jgi:SAM-dependent methyltransferase